MSYDVVEPIAQVAAIVRAALSPAPLNEVYTDFPDLQSITPPVMFFDYRGTAFNDPQTYTGYDRIFKLDLVCSVGLALNMQQTDIAMKSIIGQVYTLFASRPNSNLGGRCDEFRIVADDVGPMVALGRQVLLAVTFHAEITNYVTLANCE